MSGFLKKAWTEVIRQIFFPVFPWDMEAERWLQHYEKYRSLLRVTLVFKEMFDWEFCLIFMLQLGKLFDSQEQIKEETKHFFFFFFYTRTENFLK